MRILSYQSISQCTNKYSSHVAYLCGAKNWMKPVVYPPFSLSKVLKYILAAQGLRQPAVVSTTGRIHGELLRLLFIRADKKTPLSFEVLVEAVDVDSEVYCWRRSGDFWRMRASLCLAACNSGSVGNAGLYGTSLCQAPNPLGWSWHTLAGPQTCRIASPPT